MTTLSKKVLRLKAQDTRKKLNTLKDTGFVENLRDDDQGGGVVPGLGVRADTPAELDAIIAWLQANGGLTEEQLKNLINNYTGLDALNQQLDNNVNLPLPLDPVPSGDTINLSPVTNPNGIVSTSLPGLNDLLRQASLSSGVSQKELLEGLLKSDPRIYSILLKFSSRDRLDYLKTNYNESITVQAGDQNLSFTGEGVTQLKSALDLVSELTNNRFIYQLSDITALRSLYGNVVKNTSVFGVKNAFRQMMDKSIKLPGFNYMGVFTEAMNVATTFSDVGLILEMAVYFSEKDNEIVYHPTKPARTVSSIKSELSKTMLTMMRGFFAAYKLNPKITFRESVLEFIKLDSALNLIRPMNDGFAQLNPIRRGYPAPNSFDPLRAAIFSAGCLDSGIEPAMLSNPEYYSEATMNTLQIGSFLINARERYLDFVYDNHLNRGNWRFIFSNALFPNHPNWIDYIQAQYDAYTQSVDQNYDWKFYMDEYYTLIDTDWKTTVIAAGARSLSSINITITDIRAWEKWHGENTFNNINGGAGEPIKVEISDLYKNITNKGIIKLINDYAAFVRDGSNIINSDVSDTLANINIDELIATNLISPPIAGTENQPLKPEFEWDVMLELAKKYSYLNT